MRWHILPRSRKASRSRVQAILMRNAGYVLTTPEYAVKMLQAMADAQMRAQEAPAKVTLQ